MADWVHCNLCFKQPFEVKMQFHLTNCGHIYCENCLKQAPGFCQMCKQKSSCILLSNKMKPEVERFFTTPKDTIKQLIQVMDFQDGHRQRLLQKRKNMGQSAVPNTPHNEKTVAAFSELQKELQKFKEENNHLRRAINMLRSQHPEDMTGSRVGQSPLKRTPGVPNNFESRATPSGRQQQMQPGNTPGKPMQYHQQMMRAATDRVSIRTPPVGGVITTPSPCKLYRPSSSSGYASSQQRGRTVPGSQSSPATSQIRSRSVTPVQSLSRTQTPSRLQSPCEASRQFSIPGSQKQLHVDSVSQKPLKRTPYNSTSDHRFSPMQLNSSLDPAQRQIRLSYQPRTAMLSQPTSKSYTIQ